LTLTKKIYFDFRLEVEILCKTNGVAGILFRVKNSFNYYAFVIDKNANSKSIIKVVDGYVHPLLTVNDGGIIVNDWHKVIIELKAGDMKITIYDIEQAQSNTEKILTYTDYTFISGTVGFFVNKMPGFFFFGLTVSPVNCWSPWLPKKDIQVINSNASIYSENFNSHIETKYDILDPTNADRASEWSLISSSRNANTYGIEQKSKILDLGSTKKPAMVILKRVNFSNGVFCVKFRTEVSEGMVSIIFKYSKGITKMGEVTETFYTFDMINSRTKGQFLFRKFKDGEPMELASVNKLSGVSELGYTTQGINHVCVEAINSQITIKVGQNSNPTDIINIEDSSFASGLVGVGTYNTPALFTYLDVMPPTLKLTENDVNDIMKKDTSDLWLPSISAIKRASYELPPQSIRDSAVTTILSLSSTLGSVLGFNFNRPTPKQIGQTEVKTIFAVDKAVKLGWEKCVESKTIDDRDNICRRMFENEFKRKQCENKDNFCNMCCENTVSVEDRTVMWNCKKQCGNQNAIEVSPNDYTKVCMESDNPQTGVYNYCSRKIEANDVSKIKTCKIDMCNLCCMTLDVMKNKKYSFNTIMQCYQECSTSNSF
jgi:hypothetical protein